MVFRSTAHAVYDTSYHLVWTPKYRPPILEGAVAGRIAEMFTEIGAQSDITIDEMEGSDDHVQVCCSFPPRSSIAQVMTRFKRLRGRGVFREFPQVKRRRWGGEFWEDGYDVTGGLPSSRSGAGRPEGHRRREARGRTRGARECGGRVRNSDEQ